MLFVAESDVTEVDEDAIFTAIDNYLVNLALNIDAIHRIFKANNFDYTN